MARGMGADGVRSRTSTAGARPCSGRRIVSLLRSCLAALVLSSLAACSRSDRAPPAADAGAAPASAREQHTAPLLLQEAPARTQFSNRDAQLTRDGLRVVYVSTRDGLPQLYVADAHTPDAPVVRLTQLRQWLSSPVLPSHERSVLFRVETGQDGSTALLEAGLDTGMVAPLTPGARLQRDAPLVPRDAPLLALFSARKAGVPGSTLYRLDLLPGSEPEPVHRDAGPGLLADVSARGERALWVNGTSAREAALWVVAVDGGKARRLYPAAAGALRPVLGARFSADGERVLVATEQEGARGGLLLALDAHTGRELARFEAPGPVGDVQVAPEGGLLAVVAGPRGGAGLRLLDARTLAPRSTVRLPPGELELDHFTSDGAQLTLTWGEPGGRTNIFALDVRSGQVRALRRDGAPDLPARAAARAR